MSSATATADVEHVPAATMPRPNLVVGEADFRSLTDQVCGIVEGPAPKWWLPAFCCSVSVMMIGVFCAAYLISTGVGVWGLNHPVGWAWDITNFVFWVGIGHAGTLISAILFLFRQKWRTSINRFAEAMTIFAVCCAGIFPAIHVGRIWMVWFLAPVPNTFGIWPNFRSPLLWDVFAVSTYASVSTLFWYVGLIPDLASIRDRAVSPIRRFAYGVLSLGWRGSAKHWHNYEMAYLLLAALSTPLVLSVHTIVSFDFATSVIPGWHTTIFPPYFVAGAVFSGFAMVLTLMIPVRQMFGLKNVVTDHHLQVMCKIILVTGTMVGYAYAMEFFTAWYSGSPYESYAFLNRAFGPYWWAYWTMVSCNVICPQLFWFRWFRENVWAIWVVSLFVNLGMWFERFVIIVTSLHRDYLPSSWGYFTPTWVDIFQFVGSFGLFLTLFLIFVRVLPMIAIAEVKSILPAADPHHESHSIAEMAVDAEIPYDNGKGDGPSVAADPKYFGVLAEFPNVAQLYQALEKLRSEGYRHLDAYTPFPVHGIEKAMGMPRSRVPRFCLAGAIVGLTIALTGMLYVNVIDYPIITGGKPYGAIEPLVPIMFELAVLFGAFSAVAGMFFLNGLPRLSHPLFGAKRFSRATDDGLFVAVESIDPKFAPEATSQLLANLGATQVELVEE